MTKEIFEKSCEDIRSLYIKEYGYIPQIDNIEFKENTNSWIYVPTEEVYNKKYNLYVDQEFLNMPYTALCHTLYHEFTHISDSLNFLEKTNEDFKCIMKSYSEFHAAKRELCCILSMDNTETLSQTIQHMNGILTLESFMSQTYEKVKNDFYTMKNEKLYFNLNRFYYFCGYLSALKKFNIVYNFNFDEIDMDYRMHCIKMKHILVDKDEIDIEEVLKGQKEMINNIKAVWIIKNTLRS